MKPWIKSLLAASLLGFYTAVVLIALSISKPGADILKLALALFASFPLALAPWGFLIVYIIRRSDFSLQMRIGWGIALIAGPIGAIATPIFFFKYIIPHKREWPLFDPHAKVA